MKVFPTTMYTPQNNNGVLSAQRWDNMYEDVYINHDNGSYGNYDDLDAEIGQSGNWAVVELFNHWGQGYAEVVPNEPDCIVGCEVMTSGNFSDCWKYAEGYNTID